MTERIKTIKVNKKHWIIVYTRYQCEKKLYSILEDNNYNAFLPLYTTKRQWADRKIKIQKPLINNMVFVKINIKDIYNLYSLPYVNGILKEFGKPAIVKNYEIKNLDIIAKTYSNELITPINVNKFQKGDLVEVCSGSFKGITGTLTQINGKYRLVVQISKANTAFEINISISLAKKIKQQTNNKVTKTKQEL